MKTAYIFHDSFSTTYADWYPWLKTTLEGFGYRVIVPEFPTPAGQSLESWRVVVKNFIPTFDEETVVIGHGTGALFALRMIEDAGKQIRALVLVAPYAERIGHAGFDRVNETFLTGDFKWETIRSRAGMIRVMAGQNDPFVPAIATERLAENLGVSVETIPDGGHLNRASGFAQFVALADVVRSSEGMISKGIEMEMSMDNSQAPEFSAANDLKNKESVREGNIQEPIIKNQTIHPEPSPNEDQSLHTNPAIHTMYGDMTKLVNANDGSVASSLLETARLEETERRESSPTNPKNVGYIIGSIVAVVLAIVAVWYVIAVYLPANQVPVAPQVPSILSAESHVKISMDQPAYAIMNQVRAAYTIAPADDEIKDVYYVSGNAFTKFPAVLQALEINGLPESLVNEFAQPMFMHGASTINGKPAHFLMIPGGNYDVLFRGMREWEPTMVRDLGLFMNIPDSFLKTKITRDVFTDEVIANRNVRVARYHAPEIPAESVPGGVSVPDEGVTAPDGVTTPDAANFISTGLTAVQNNPFLNTTAPYQDGELMLAYFFLTERTVVIVDNLDVIPEILSRYANRQIYQ